MDKKERQAASAKKHYLANKELMKERARARNAVRLLEIQEYIRKCKSVPCMDCNQVYPPFVMDFDHREPDQKEFTIARAYSSLYGQKKLEAEVAKCDVVCSNCHRVRTHERNVARLTGVGG